MTARRATTACRDITNAVQKESSTPNNYVTDHTDVAAVRKGLALLVKTRYLYSMTSRLINVRLDADRLRKAQKLRERGVALSDVVREAIDERFLELRSTSRPDVKTIVRRIFEQYPDPADLSPRDYDVHDRRVARAAILRKVRRTRS